MINFSRIVSLVVDIINWQLFGYLLLATEGRQQKHFIMFWQGNTIRVAMLGLKNLNQIYLANVDFSFLSLFRNFFQTLEPVFLYKIQYLEMCTLWILFFYFIFFSRAHVGGLHFAWTLILVFCHSLRWPCMRELRKGKYQLNDTGYAGSVALYILHLMRKSSTLFYILIQFI